MKTPRPIRVDGSLAYVPLTQGYEAVIDAVDAPLVDNHNWCASVKKHNVYAMRKETCGVTGKRVNVFMHREIAAPSLDEQVGHVNHDGLDNRRENLRACSPTENARNRRLRSDNRVGLKGVAWHKGKKKWRSRIRISGVEKFLGYFDCPEKAHAAYLRAAEDLFGDHACSG